MFRIKIAMIVLGGVLGFFGIQEFRVSSGTSSEPQHVELAQLEKGDIPKNTHLQIGSHYAVYGATIYEYEQSKYEASSGPSPSSKLTMCYYPIISLNHPFVEAMENDEDFEFGQLAVLVKTKRFKKFGAIPDVLMTEENAVQGLVINTVDSLDREEEKLLKQRFPRIDVDNVLILQEGRKPTSLFASGGMILGGLALILVGGALFFVPAKR